MTIGIGAFGPNAGRAVYDALAAAEAVASKSIGGFATFCVIDEQGVARFAATQRGGSRTLFTEGEITGRPPPPDVSRARFAAVISSGPDRPEPLSQFIAVDSQVGLVTGHRFPNYTAVDGAPLHELVLRQMSGGKSPAAALSVVLEANPQADSGLIAVSTNGGIARLNSARVASRSDVGEALGIDRDEGIGVAVLHNSIVPVAALAELVAEIALVTMRGYPPPAGEFHVRAGTRLVLGERACVRVEDSVATEIVVTEAHLLQGRQNCSAIYMDTPVIRDCRIIGLVASEANIVVVDGQISSLSGRSEACISYRALPKEKDVRE